MPFLFLSAPLSLPRCPSQPREADGSGKVEGRRLRRRHEPGAGAREAGGAEGGQGRNEGERREAEKRRREAEKREREERERRLGTPERLYNMLY